MAVLTDSHLLSWLFTLPPRIVVKYNFKTLCVQMWHRIHSLYTLSISRTLHDNSHYASRCCTFLAHFEFACFRTSYKWNFLIFLGGRGSGLFNKVQPYCRIHTSEFVPLKHWLISFVHFIYVFIQGWLCFHRLDLFWCWEHWLADTHFFSFWHMYILEGFYHSTYFSSLAAPALWMSSCTLLNA